INDVQDNFIFLLDDITCYDIYNREKDDSSLEHSIVNNDSSINEDNRDNGATRSKANQQEEEENDQNLRRSNRSRKPYQ
ncbi:unnamed protein product, partial [Sphenostylis stenocarpa]